MSEEKKELRVNDWVFLCLTLLSALLVIRGGKLKV